MQVRNFYGKKNWTPVVAGGRNGESEDEFSEDVCQDSEKDYVPTSSSEESSDSGKFFNYASYFNVSDTDI